MSSKQSPIAQEIETLIAQYKNDPKNQDIGQTIVELTLSADFKALSAYERSLLTNGMTDLRLRDLIDISPIGAASNREAEPEAKKRAWEILMTRAAFANEKTAEALTLEAVAFIKKSSTTDDEQSNRMEDLKATAAYENFVSQNLDNESAILDFLNADSSSSGVSPATPKNKAPAAKPVENSAPKAASAPDKGNAPEETSDAEFWDPKTNAIIARGMRLEATLDDKNNAWSAIELRLGSANMTDAQKERAVLEALRFLQTVKTTGWDKGTKEKTEWVAGLPAYKDLSPQAILRITEMLKQEQEPSVKPTPPPAPAATEVEPPATTPEAEISPMAPSVIHPAAGIPTMGISWSATLGLGLIGGLACFWFFGPFIAIFGALAGLFTGAVGSVKPVDAKKAKGKAPAATKSVETKAGSEAPKAPTVNSPKVDAPKAPKKSLAVRLGASRPGLLTKGLCYFTAKTALGIANVLDGGSFSPDKAPSKKTPSRMSAVLGSPKVKKGIKSFLSHAACIGLGVVGVMGYQHFNKVEVAPLAAKTPITTPTAAPKSVKSTATSAESPSKVIVDGVAVSATTGQLPNGATLFTIAEGESWKNILAQPIPPVNLEFKKFSMDSIPPLVDLKSPAPRKPLAIEDAEVNASLGLPALITEGAADTVAAEDAARSEAAKGAVNKALGLPSLDSADTPAIVADEEAAAINDGPANSNIDTVASQNSEYRAPCDLVEEAPAPEVTLTPFDKIAEVNAATGMELTVADRLHLLEEGPDIQNAEVCLAKAVYHHRINISVSPAAIAKKGYIVACEDKVFADAKIRMAGLNFPEIAKDYIADLRAAFEGNLNEEIAPNPAALKLATMIAYDQHLWAATSFGKYLPSTDKEVREIAEEMQRVDWNAKLPMRSPVERSLGSVKHAWHWIWTPSKRATIPWARCYPQ